MPDEQQQIANADATRAPQRAQEPPPAPAASDPIPLCVELDGAMTRTSIVLEGAIRLLRDDFLNAVRLPLWRLRGRVEFEYQIAARARLDITRMPVNEAFVDWLRQQRPVRRLILCGTNPEMERIAAHYLLFDEFVAALPAARGQPASILERLRERFGAGGFDYAGRHLPARDLWLSARRTVAVNPDRRLRRQIPRLPNVEEVFERARRPARAWLRAMRLHQWSKNVLLFLPAAGAHVILQPLVAFACCVAFMLFSCCASATYIFNDLMDLEADRGHPTKRHRPFAAGELPIGGGLLFACLLLGASLLAAFLVLGAVFFATLALYTVATVWYSRSLKRIPMVDVLALAGLYSIRIVAGSAATALVPSFWLLALTMFLFLSLAVAKRYAELKVVMASGRRQSQGRGYTVDDAPLLQSCGLSAGYMAVLVMALYINSDMAQKTYAHLQVLWLLCPLLLYWITRVWIKTSRGQMDDDPVVFALRDRPSITVACLCLVLMVAAT